MAEPVTLREEDIGRIGEYVKPWIRELVDRMVPRAVPAGVDNQLLERMVRVEEELKAQRELMAERFEAVDKRFSMLTWMIGIGFVVITTLTTVFALLG
jgi:hypothetical protein